MESPSCFQKFAGQKHPEPDVYQCLTDLHRSIFHWEDTNIFFGEFILWGNLILCSMSKLLPADVKALFLWFPTHSCVLSPVHGALLPSLLQLVHVPPGGRDGMLPSGFHTEANPGYSQRHTDIFFPVFHSFCSNSFQVPDAEVIRCMSSEGAFWILLGISFI